MNGRVLTGVGGILSCAHEPVSPELFGGELHGHSYEIVAWFDNARGPRDVRILKAALDTLLAQWDHKVLPAELSTGEAIARAVGMLANVVAVDVNRPLERIYARWEA